MGRIRTIKPETPSDEALATVSRDARLTFVYLITQADDDGLVLASPRQLLGALYPHDADVTEPMVVAWCEELAGIGCVRWRTTKGGSPVLELVNWAEHQKIKHRAKPVIATTLLPYVDADSTTVATLPRSSRAAPEALPPSSGGPPEDLRRPSPTNQQPWTMDQLQTVDHGPATSNQVVDPASNHHRAMLAAAANKGATERFGTTPAPRYRWDQPGTFALCEALAADAVPFDFAVPALYTAATRGTAEGAPPRSLKYFAQVVVRLWREQQQQAHDGDATSDRFTVIGGREKTWDDLHAELDRELTNAG